MHQNVSLFVIVCLRVDTVYTFKSVLDNYQESSFVEKSMNMNEKSTRKAVKD